MEGEWDSGGWLFLECCRHERLPSDVHCDLAIQALSLTLIQGCSSRPYIATKGLYFQTLSTLHQQKDKIRIDEQERGTLCSFLIIVIQKGVV